MINPSVVKRYMRDNVEAHVDPRTNEVNSTSLAEDACDHFQDYVNEDEIPEEYFEWSLEVATAHEKKLAEEYASHGRGYLSEVS